ncbi:amidohydrolase family protein [Auraticoccus sp. F435]|uniref:Amidohydrolase family protein n=1 Tax=Auraticoccus cholistanensis TaxID=2656650 RepID=A0A6A9USP1_9ACTN|nr:amidohydrolase family protein [Auraticoccus cholistanensis]MVA74702.1 amidohydrolase family protein [Auraticoccus cholistanensis]
MVIDSHLHVWDRSRSRYAWLDGADPRLTSSLHLADVRPELAAAAVTGVVLVQADDTVEETEYLLEVAAAEPEVLGVVGYVPLHEPETVAELLPRWQQEPRLVGLRNLTHDRPDPDWILRPDVTRGVELVAAAGLPLDYVAVLPQHLADAAVLARRHPGLTVVLDHLGKPPLGAAAERRQEWERLLRAVAAEPGVVAKVSGLYGADDPDAWTPADLAWAVEVALDAFGPERLMYGGDWPVSLLAGGYTRVWQGLSAALQRCSEQERRQVLQGTATTVYRLPAAGGTR